MEQNDLVSVIIPCYNHAEFLEATIQSVVNSTYKPLEVIIVNDGSTDHSEQVAQKLAAKYSNVKYLFQKNQGPSAARNNGIKKAQGKYILPLDADDLISSEYIEEAVHYLHDGNTKLVYCEAEFFGEKQGRWKLPDFSRDKLVRDNMIFCSALYRKQDWESCGGYDERMTWGWEDWEFWISMLKNGGEVKKIPQVGFYYRVRKKSRRKSTNKEAKRKTIELINEKHKTFVYSHLGGPLRKSRSLSKIINLVYKNILGRKL